MAKKRKSDLKEEPAVPEKDLIETSDDEEQVEYEEVEESDEEESSDSKRESVRKLLEPFGKDQLIEILKEAALRNQSIIDRILQLSETDTVHRKIFVHGLGWDCTNETLLATFNQYGDIEIGNVVTDKITGKSKGFGFVLFKTSDAARKALKEPHKKIGNRMSACQLASLGPVPNHPVPDSTGRKIYVANVGPEINPEKLRAFFASFGEIEEGPLGFDKVTGKLRGFALFVYKTAEGCKKALEQPNKLFQGCQLQCRKAMEGLSNSKQKTVPGENIVNGLGFPSMSLPINYGMGFNPGMIGQNLSPGIGLLTSATLGTSLTPGGYSPSVARGLSPLANREAGVSPMGLGGGYGMQSSINSISPSVIGNYGSQAALQGLGAYQSAQLGQSSAANIARSQSGIGSLGTLPSYFGR
ncbi:hypothetical protein ACHQM5_024622 [Ranunculus cassubicifolius]